MKQILQEGLQNGLIEERDFHYDDFYLLDKIEGSLDLSRRIEALIRQELDLGQLKTKKRRVAPEILIDTKLVRLSELN